MPRHTLPLADVQIRNAKPQAKPLKLTDGGGLHLLIIPSGGKLWRLKYRYGGKEKLLSFGEWPNIYKTVQRHPQVQLFLVPQGMRMAVQYWRPQRAPQPTENMVKQRASS